MNLVQSQGPLSVKCRRTEHCLARGVALKTLLYINFDFPPSSGPGIWRALGFVKYLPSNGWRSIVLCSDRSVSRDHQDPALCEEIPPGTSFPQGRAQEERRAARRAEKIAVWVREALNRPIPVRKLNVGHHAPTGSDDTSEQRRVVIILVLDHDEDANIDQSLRSAMAAQSVRAPIFEALLTKYSLGGGDSFTWVP